MKAVIQRVKQASVEVNGLVKGMIGQGVLILIGIIEGDSSEDIEWLAGKIARLRIFPDDKGVMNHSLLDIEGQVLLVSQFTLYASIKKGNRPYYGRSAGPDIAIPLYEKFKTQMEQVLGQKVETGEFGADMKVSLINDGPVTIILDSKNIE